MHTGCVDPEFDEYGNIVSLPEPFHHVQGGGSYRGGAPASGSITGQTGDSKVACEFCCPTHPSMNHGLCIMGVFCEGGERGGVQSQEHQINKSQQARVRHEAENQVNQNVVKNRYIIDT